MLNFAVGPVQMSDTICAIGGEQIPYFRTAEFSEILLESERLMKKFCGAEEKARPLFLTGSGTAAMEAVVMNTFSEKDKVLVVNGGSFGQRFVDICAIHRIPYTEIKTEPGKGVTAEQLNAYAGGGHTGFLINMHETSTGVLYNMPLVSKFCTENDLFLVVDAISAFLSDPIDMGALRIGALITGSQKALACPPGVSIAVLSQQGVARVEAHPSRSLYFDLRKALKDGERGQTPFTPAVGTLLQIHARLREIEKNGGVESEHRRMEALAEDFRGRIRGLPLRIFSDSLSNAVTPLSPLNTSAYQIFLTLKEDYHIWVCPNGGALAERLFRVGHMGNLSVKDNEILVNALYDMQERGRL